MNKAQRIANAIKRNVDEFLANRVSYPRWSERDYRLWRRAETARVDDELMGLVKPSTVFNLVLGHQFNQRRATRN